MTKMRKALAAAVAAGVAAFTAAATDGQVTTLEWATVGAAALLAGYAVWRIPNATPPN